jgi:hypothetical protein
VSRPSGEFGSTLEIASTIPDIGVRPARSDIKQNFESLLGTSDKDTPLFKHWAASLTTVGQTFTVFTDSGYPDYWIVYVMPTWTASPGQVQPTFAAIYQAPFVGKDADCYLSGGGMARLPGVSEYLTVEGRLIGSNNVNFGIIAVRKTDVDTFVWPGQG